jgi:deoxyribodipyrimidine photolyase-related protein
MHCVYQKEGVRQRNSNFFNHQNTLNEKFYTGQTGMAPVDYLIRQLNGIGYSHHIERLMVLSNFMQLVELHPTEVYRWFMEMYVDAYDWVMVPNVYGMSLYADGGILSTKPYVSGSGYIKKMSDFSTRGPWIETWNALYWRFIFVNREKLESNPRMKLIYRSLDRMQKESLYEKIDLAEKYIKELYSS